MVTASYKKADLSAEVRKLAHLGSPEKLFLLKLLAKRRVGLKEYSDYGLGKMWS